MPQSPEVKARAIFEIDRARKITVCILQQISADPSNTDPFSATLDLVNSIKLRDFLFEKQRHAAIFKQARPPSFREFAGIVTTMAEMFFKIHL